MSRTLNYALSDYAIAQAAKKLGHDNDYTVLMNRSRAAYERVLAIWGRSEQRVDTGEGGRVA